MMPFLRLVRSASLSIALIVPVAWTSTAAAQCSPTRVEAVQGVYRQVLEREATPGEVAFWQAPPDSARSMRYIVQQAVYSVEYQTRFITGRTNADVTKQLYLHLMAREPVGNEWSSAPVGSDWSGVMNALLNSSEYTARFGDRGVPGSPMQVWDCAKPGLSLEPAQASATQMRGMCLTIAVSGGAYECGDLRLAHALPSVRIRSKARTPVLLYNSQHAQPHPLVGAYVTLPAAADRVDATVAITGQASHTGSWTGWGANVSRRITIGWDWDILQPTGLYPYTLQVTAYSGSTVVASYSASGEMAVVNRSASAFGAGWWLAGFEQVIAVSNNRLLWVGGDGSTQVYNPASFASYVWYGDVVSRGDTIRQYVPTSTQPYTFARELPGKAKIWYDSAGFQIASEDRFAHRTTFDVDPATKRLNTIHLYGVSGYQYGFTYANAGKLSAATLTAGTAQRSVTMSVDGTGRLTQFTDPDATTEVMTFDTAALTPRRVATQTDARGTVSRFGYDAGGKLANSRLEMQGQGSDIVLGFQAQETRGLAPAANQPPGAPAWTTDTYTLMGGPRTDSTIYNRFWLDRWGAPRKIVNARGDSTAVVVRGDPRFPGAVTRMDALGAGGTRMVSRAWYNARGGVDSTAAVNPFGPKSNGSDSSAVTKYTYGDTSWPDFVTEVRSPTGLLTKMHYDAAGNRDFQQVGQDSMRGVRYHYDSEGRVDWVRSAAAGARGEAAEQVLYDAVLGNPSETLSPLGARTTSLSDAYGRVYLTRSYIDATHLATDSTVYDVMDQVTHTYSYAPSLQYTTVAGSLIKNTAHPTLHVQSYYDRGGLLLRADRWSDPDSLGIDTISTRWRYDPAGRKVSEMAPDNTPGDTINNTIERTFYDAAGNADSVVTRLGDHIRMKYDVLNRLTDRYVPSRSDVNGAIPGDTSHFEYDAGGGMLAANNATARISRSYYPGGALNTDRSWVASSSGSFVQGQHDYTIGHVYDLEGRQVALNHPRSLTQDSAAWQTTYAYDDSTGALASVTDPLGHINRFRYTLEGQLDTLVLPGNIRETHHYDADGRMTRRIRSSLYDDSLVYDRRGKVTTARTMSDIQQMAYDGLGHLVWSFQDRIVNTPQESDSEEEYGFDALGNTTFRLRMGIAPGQVNAAGYPIRESYELGTGRHLGSHTPTNSTIGVAQQRHEKRVFNAAGDAVSDTTIAGLQLITAGSSANQNSAYFTEFVQAWWVDEKGDYHQTADTVSGPGAPDQSGRQVLSTNSSYRADGKLAIFRRDADCLYSLAAASCTGQAPAHGSQDLTETYAYDALGRRVLVRTTTPEGNYPLGTALPGTCPSDLPRCDNTTKRTVWDGDQVLYEMRYPNTQADKEAGLDSTNIAALAHRAEVDSTAQGHAYGGPNTSAWAPSGRVAYVHAGRLDQPLGLIRMDYSYDFPDPVLIVPHANWKSAYETSTFDDGYATRCKTVWMPSNEVITSGSGSSGGEGGTIGNTNPEEGPDTTQVRCIERDFPGAYMGVSRLLKRQTVYGPIAWMGSLVQDAQDASGLMYRRNRYYDPQTGKFTQEDPAGLAGGINAYGFANGDPIQYSDPLGLCGEKNDEVPCPNPKANGSEPLYERPGESPVHLFSPEIDQAARETGVDGRLIRSVMYMETTHGWYDFLPAIFDRNSSVLPMNVQTARWGPLLGFTREQLKQPETNILAGARILQQIISTMPKGATVAQIATRYNNQRAGTVSDYGARVARIYVTQPWQTSPLAFNGFACAKAGLNCP
jgi:RHS repeat-associated protein